MMKRSLFTITLVTVLWTAHAQYTQYSLYRFAEPRINPANLGLTNYASFGALYRSQQSQPGVKLNSAYIQASYPFLRRKGTWSALGIEASNDQEGVGGIFQTNELGLQYGYHIPLSKYKRLALGASAHYFSRRVDISDLRTGSQFVGGVGFDPALEQGEGFQNTNANYLSFGGGIKYQVVDKKSLPKTYVGASFFHLNQPQENFIRDQQLPVNLVAEIGQQVMQKKYSRVYLEALIWQVQNNTTLNAGVVTWIDLQKYDSRLRGQSLNLFLKYLHEEGGMVGFQWDNQVFSLGVSYDVPLMENTAHQGAFEVGLKVRQAVRAKSKKKKRKKNSTSRRFTRPVRRTNPNDDEDELTIARRREEPIAVEDSVQSVQLDSIAEPKDVLIVHFGFEFGDTDPIIEDEYVFEQVLDRMEEDPTLRIEVVGHTDDVGPARFNQRLSVLRAQAIFDILFELGADPDRMEFLGKGEDEPLVPNDTDENRAENRRVEIVFIHPE